MEKEIKFEKLKKSHKKEIIIGGMIILGIVSAITLTTSRAKYRLTQSIPIVRGTVNYKPYDLKIMAMYKQKEGSTCTEDSCYDEITGEMPSSGYVVNEDKTYCTTDNSTQVKGKIKTENGKHYITGLKKNDKCYIWFDKEIEPVEATLVKLNIKNYNVVPPSFSKIADTDEGVFRVEDGMYGGYSYYWRGAVTNNHVIFGKHRVSTSDVYYGFESSSNQTSFKEYDSLSVCQNAESYNIKCKPMIKADKDICWRIIRINGDGSIRLIYNGIAINGQCSDNGTYASDSGSIAIAQQRYNTHSAEGWTYTVGSLRPTPTTGGTPSNAKAKTDEWFTENIKGTSLEKVADGKFCNDRDTSGGNFAGGLRISSSNFAPTLDCPTEDIYTLKVGAITADEAVFAGAGWYNKPNVSYYLYNAKNFWTMTPRSGGQLFYVSGNGAVSNISYNTVGVENLGLRPVINLKATTTFQDGGLGTSERPYVVAN